MKFRIPNFPDLTVSMDMGDPRNPHLVGSGQLPGGRYDSVTLSGSGKILGSLETERATFSGSVEIAGDLSATEMGASGTLSVQGSLTAGRANCAGSTRVRAGLRGGSLTFGGALEVAGDIEVDSLRGDGALEAGSVRAAAAIELRLSGGSAVRTLTAPRIEIGPGSGASSSRIRAEVFVSNVSLNGVTVSSIIQNDSAEESGGGRLRADTIRGDAVTLEATTARRVEGGKVRIGPGCIIEQVRYRESLDIAATASVEERIKES